MKRLAKIAFQSTLIVAFVVGSLAYWAALGILAASIWIMALLYAGIFRVATAFQAFIVVLFSPSPKTKAAKSNFWS